MKAPIVGEVICHVLLCETADDGLVLVDSGLGRHDFADPRRMGPARFLLRPERDDAHTAVAQVEAMGFSAGDVSHVVLTHMDFDHIGGIADFPDATIHTTADEYAWAVAEPDLTSRQRYSRRQWSHGPHIRTHVGPGDTWRFGLSGMEVLPGITYLPMPGHTKGHAAVAVETGKGELLVHAGDAVFDASCYTPLSPSGQVLTRINTFRRFEKVLASDRTKIAGNHATLSRLDQHDGVTVLNAHDKRIFEDLVRA